MAGLPPHRASAGTSEPFIRNESASSCTPASHADAVVDERAHPERAAGPIALRSDLNAPSSCEWHWMIAAGVQRAAVTDGDERALGERAAVVEHPPADPHAQQPPEHGS